MTNPQINTNDVIAPDVRQLLDRVADQRFELAYIKSSSTYRLSERLRRGAGLRRRARTVVVRVLGRNGRGQGPEAWLLRASGSAGEPGVPWDFAAASGFERRASKYASHGQSLFSRQGEVSFVAGRDPELVFMTHPWSGLVEVEFEGRRETIDLFSEVNGHVSVYPARSPMIGVPEAGGGGEGAGAGRRASSDEAMTARDMEFLRHCQHHEPETVAVHCPRWLGISASTRALFDTRYCVPETPEIDPAALSRGAILRHARVLAESGVPHVVVSGGDLAQLALVEELKRLKPGVQVDVIYHGGYVAFQLGYEWQVVKTWIDACKKGLVRGICTVKAGMEDFFRSQGVPSALVLNMVPGEVMAPSEPAEPGLHAGIWTSGTGSKTPHVMLSALKMMGDVRLHAAGMDQRAREVIELLGLAKAEVHPRPLPHALLLEAMRRTHLTLYVTFHECCPMLPLESLTQGVPSLLGPVSHLFEDCPYLFERLVVPFPDRADVVAKYARRAIEERREIVAAYAAYAPEYNERARRSVRELAENGPTLEMSRRY
ncbi:MAG: hypothetical protein GC200_07000 [Tepidisphaera sp.]|nr:hypothetical protein [Tepidisphaera sp.]